MSGWGRSGADREWGRAKEGQGRAVGRECCGDGCGGEGAEGGRWRARAGPAAAWSRASGRRRQMGHPAERRQPDRTPGSHPRAAGGGRRRGAAPGARGAVGFLVRACISTPRCCGGYERGTGGWMTVDDRRTGGRGGSTVPALRMHRMYMQQSSRVLRPTTVWVGLASMLSARKADISPAKIGQGLMKEARDNSCSRSDARIMQMQYARENSPKTSHTHRDCCAGVRLHCHGLRPSGRQPHATMW